MQPSTPPFPQQRVVVMRHGERRDFSPGAAPEVDPPLTRAGREAVASSAEQLKSTLGIEAARNLHLLCSPFARCIETALLLRECDVGTRGPLVVNNSFAEVYGSVRINAQSSPTLELDPSFYTVGKLPEWGETLEEAYNRYVENFLYCSARTASAMLSPVDPAAPIGALQGRLPERRLRSGLNGHVQHTDILIVTHGDALSAVLNRFYPHRTIYETEFLSFIVMRRYDLTNDVFHLEHSVGVNWIVDGPDHSPSDAMLEAFQRGSHSAVLTGKVIDSRRSDDSAPSSSSIPGEHNERPDHYFKLNDDDEFDELPVPHGVITRNRRTSRPTVAKKGSTQGSPTTLQQARPPRQPSPSSAATVTPPELHPVGVGSPNLSDPPSLPRTSNPHHRGSRLGLDESRSASTPTASSRSKATPFPSASYPNVREGCEKTRPPIGPLSQSSAIPQTRTSAGQSTSIDRTTINDAAQVCFEERDGKAADTTLPPYDATASLSPCPPSARKLKGSASTEMALLPVDQLFSGQETSAENSQVYPMTASSHQVCVSVWRSGFLRFAGALWPSLLLIPFSRSCVDAIFIILVVVLVEALQFVLLLFSLSEPRIGSVRIACEQMRGPRWAAGGPPQNDGRYGCVEDESTGHAGELSDSTSSRGSSATSTSCCTRFVRWIGTEGRAECMLTIARQVLPTAVKCLIIVAFLFFSKAVVAHTFKSAANLLSTKASSYTCAKVLLLSSIWNIIRGVIDEYDMNRLLGI